MAVVWVFTLPSVDFFEVSEELSFDLNKIRPLWSWKQYLPPKRRNKPTSWYKTAKCDHYLNK